MRIALVARELPPRSGGMGQAVYDLATALAKQNHDVTILVSKAFRNHVPIPARVAVMPTFGPEPLRSISFGAFAAEFLNRRLDGFDVLHLHFGASDFVPPLLASPCRVPIVGTVHSTSHALHMQAYSIIGSEALSTGDLLFRPWWGAFMRKAETYAYRKCTRLTGVSRAVVRELRETYGLKAPIYIPNGIDVARFSSPSNNNPAVGPPTVLFVGHLRSEKGIFSAIAALTRVRNPFRLVIAGSGALLAKLQKEIIGNVRFDVNLLGFVPNVEMPRVYAAANVLLMPSYSEGLPIVGLEGAASGLPIAGFDATSAADFVAQENLPYIVKTGDINNLARSLDVLLSDEALRRQIGERNRRRIAEEFTITSIAERFLKLYESNEEA